MKNSKKVKKFGFWVTENEIHVWKGKIIEIPVRRYIFYPNCNKK
jgi:hypothetical protein